MADLNMTLYGKYTIGDLCITETGLDNTPTEDLHINNLRWLAIVLSELEPSLGSFTILSAYRTREVNNKVTGNSDPNRKTSFHEVGMAVDFHPIGQTINSYFGKLITTEWRNKLGEIILKPKQNSIHIGLPTASYKGAIKILDPKTGSYRYMTEEEIEHYSEGFKNSMMPESSSQLDFYMSYPDSSGGLFTELYTGAFGIYGEPTLSEGLEASLDDAFSDSPSEDESGFSFSGIIKKSLLAGGILAGIYALLFRNKEG